MENHLYDIFKHWYYASKSKKGTIYFYSDPHFGDLDCYKMRFPEKFGVSKDDKFCLHLSNVDINNYQAFIVKELDQMQIDNINKKCTKRDTLVILGDVGDVECVKRLKAGYKVLIMGNHDKGASNYKRVRKGILLPNDKIIKSENGAFSTTEPDVYNVRTGYLHEGTGNGFKDTYGIVGDYDNKLFDEVYEGTLQISPKIILSHEPVEYRYCMNIHGHSHGANSQVKILEVTDDDTEYNIIEVNMCAEFINYTPVGIKDIIKLGFLSKVEDIHREVVKKHNKIHQGK